MLAVALLLNTNPDVAKKRQLSVLPCLPAGRQTFTKRFFNISYG
jgi:hypothetical protein